MNKHLSKASGIWAKNVYIENEQKHYIFTEKSLERFAQDILDECMYLCLSVFVCVFVFVCVCGWVRVCVFVRE